MIAFLVVNRVPNAATKDKNSLQDWDSFLHSLWLEITKTNPGIYDDAKVNHAMGHCPCHCTAKAFLTEVKT